MSSTCLSTSTSHPLLPKDMSLPSCGIEYFLRCVPRLWYSSKKETNTTNHPTTNKTKINNTIRRVNKTESKVNNYGEPFAGRPVVSPRAFRNRLVNIPDNPVTIQIKSNGNALLIPYKKRDVQARLDVLRVICGLPNCKFNRMPKPVIYKFGFNVNSINKAIDEYINSKVGSDPSGIITPTEIVSGVTRYGDGYKLMYFEETKNTKIAVCFDKSVKDKYMFGISLDPVFDKLGNLKNFLVQAYKMIGKTPNAQYCRKFMLFDRVDPLQFNVKVVLASVLEKIPDYESYFGTYFGQKYYKRFKFCKHQIYSSCRQYTQFCLNRVGANSSAHPIGRVDSADLTKGKCKIELKYLQSGKESFRVINSKGDIFDIPNDRHSIRNMYNATLDDGKYVIHPKCYTPYYTRFENHKNQFCWINIFARAKIFMPRELVPFPELNYGFLVNCGLGDYMKGRLKSTGPGLLHYDGKYHGFKQTVRYSSKVGVKLETEPDHLIKNIEMLFDELCTGVVTTSNLRGDNPLMNNLTNRMSDMINKQCNKPKDLVVNTCLNNRQKRELTELFPEINYDFKDSSYSSHPLATAMRHTENFLLARSCNNREFIDAGGNVVHHLHKLVSDVHVCSPVVDVKDAHRHMTRSLQMDKLKGISEKVTVCSKLTQDCDVEYPNIISVQVYDMSLIDMAKALSSHKAKRYDFSIIIPPEIYEDNCDVLLFDDSVRVRVVGDKVKYDYGSSGESYFHDRENLKRILTTQIFEVDGIIYKKTLECSRKQLHFFSIVPCVDMLSGTYKLETHYPRSELDKLQVRVPVEDNERQVSMDVIKIEKSNYHHMIEYAMNTVLKLDEKAYEYLLSQYRARKSVSIRGGKVTQITCDLNPKAVAGLIGALAGCALRLREQAHRSAKLAYLDFYAPSLLRYLAKIICVCFKRLNNWSKRFFEKVLRCITPESILQQIKTESCGVYTQEGEYGFVQTVVVINEGQRRNVISDSIEKFKKFNEKLYDNLDSSTRDNQEFFTPDMQDVMNDMFDLGGGGVSIMTGGNPIYLFSLNFYTKIFETFNWFCKDVKKCEKFSNFVCGVWSFFRSRGLNAIKLLKDVILHVIEFLKSGTTKLSKNVAKNLKKAYEIVKTSLTKGKVNWERELELALRELDEDYESANDSSDFDDKVIETDYQSDNIENLYDLVNVGGGSRLCGISCFKHFTFKETLRYLKARFEYYRVKSLIYLNRFLEFSKLRIQHFKTFFNKWYDMLFSEEFIDGALNILSFNTMNIFFSLIVGDISIFRLIASTIYHFYMTCYGYKSTILGGESTVKSIGFMLLTPSFPGLITLPLKLTGDLCFRSKLKMKLNKYERFKPAATQLIAKDALLKNKFLFFDGMNMQRVCVLSMIVMILDTKLGLAMLLTAYLLNSFMHYIKNVCLGTNILISYGKQLDRVNATMRYKKLRSLFAQRFDKSRFNEVSKEDGEEEDQIASKAEICRVGNNLDDSDVEVELDHTGKIICDKSNDPSLFSTCQSNHLEDRVDGLNFSLLQPTIDRTQIDCNVSFSLSHALLIYPKTDNLEFVQTGNDLLDSVKEFYYLEAKRLHDELGRLNGAVKKYYELNLETKSTKDVIWHLRNYLDDSSLYTMVDSRHWYRLGKKDYGHCSMEAECKYTSENELVDFDCPKPGLQICSDELIGMFSNKRCIALESIIKTKSNRITSIRNRDITFFNKPPGAGKTTEIVNNLIEDIKNRRVSVALTHTANGKKEIIQKLRAKGISGASKKVFTYDSILMKNETAKVDRLYCDEIFMVHSGEWLAICALYDTELIYCYGDRNQIPFINRVANTICKYHKDTYLSFKTIDDNKSYRCPVDVCYLLSNLKDDCGNLLYPNGVFPVGDNRHVLRSIEAEPITSVDSAVFDVNGKNISFTRPEREEIDQAVQRAKIAGLSVNTVHEVQGGTFPSVYLYRLRKYDNPIYENINQFVVSISRHTKCLRYRVITDKLYDKIGERISAINNVQDYIIKEHMFKQHV
nr:polyprotein [chieh-qua chlorotic virus]